jgi:hypothetical protein
MRQSGAMATTVIMSRQVVVDHSIERPPKSNNRRDWDRMVAFAKIPVKAEVDQAGERRLSTAVLRLVIEKRIDFMPLLVWRY